MPNATPTQADASKSIAWIVSISVHAGIGVLAFFITWSVVRIEEGPPQVVTSTWHEQPVNESAKLPMALPPSPILEMDLPALPLPSSKAAVQDGFAVLHEISSGGEIPERPSRRHGPVHP